jgi:uncharacterized membrane protein HdeD (DUF308 family)/CRP-like cAMP-binding protein
MALNEHTAFFRRLSSLPVETYQSGQVVLAAGSTTGRLLVLKEGEVAIIKDGSEIAKVAEPGAVFGEMSILLDQPHNAEVRAITSSQFHIAPAAMLYQHPTLLYYVANILAQRLDSADRVLAELKNEIQTGQPATEVGKTVKELEEELSVSKSTKANIDDVVHHFEKAVSRSLHAHWFLYMLEGILLILLGIATVAIPPLGMVAITILLGWVFVISGGFGLVSTLWLREEPGFGWSLLSAILGITVGIAMFAMPIEAAFAITVVLVIFFVIEGAGAILYALARKRELSGKWEWMLASGVIDLALGMLIVIYMPTSTSWALSGLLVGINMLTGGVALVLMATHARKEIAYLDSEAAIG